MWSDVISLQKLHFSDGEWEIYIVDKEPAARELKWIASAQI